MEPVSASCLTAEASVGGSVVIEATGHRSGAVADYLRHGTGGSKHVWVRREPLWLPGGPAVLLPEWKFGGSTQTAPPNVSYRATPSAD